MRRTSGGDAAAGTRRRPRLTMTYVDAALAPLRKTGQIKLYGPDAFAGMRKAGRLVPACLDMLAAEVKPGVPTARPHPLGFGFSMGPGGLPAPVMSPPTAP